MPRRAPKTRARAAVLAAALRTYRDAGARGFRLDAVAARAGLTTPAIYRHFSGKDALLRELVQQGFDEFGQYLARALAGRSPRERLVRTAAAYFDFAVDHRRHYETIFLTLDIHKLRWFPRDFERGRSATFQMLVDRVRECLEAGVLAKGDPAAIALSMWVHVHGFMSLYLTGRFGASRARVRAMFDASLERLLEGLNP